MHILSPVLTPFFGLCSSYVLVGISEDKYCASWTFVLTWYTIAYMIVGSRPTFSKFPSFGSISKGKIEKKRKHLQFSNILMLLFVCLFICFIFLTLFVITRQVLNSYRVVRGKTDGKGKEKSLISFVISYKAKSDEASITITTRSENKC